MIQKIKRTVILGTVSIGMSSLVYADSCEKYCKLNCGFPTYCIHYCREAQNGTQQDKKTYKEFQEMHCPVQGMTRRSE
ncbi:MAG TPA: hypothetical protein PLY23_03695 [Alphaproteobacteria bacterium]|nr:hypothetical protein [Alphaproteobacteria bacterium]HQS93860.1 hypothetical protein [Alphaproteobacteria bacterium]